MYSQSIEVVFWVSKPHMRPMASIEYLQIPDIFCRRIKEIQSAKNTEDEMHKLQHQREINDLQQKLIQVWLSGIYSARHLASQVIVQKLHQLQVQNTLAEERKQSEETISSLKNRLVDETATLSADYELKIQAECNKFSDLKTELGIAKKKLNMWGYDHLIFEYS